MLDKVTWTHYSLTLLAVLTLYYAIVLITCFRLKLREFRARFRSRRSTAADPSGPIVGEDSATATVMGKPKEDPGVSFFTSQELRFAAAPPAGHDDLLRQIPELLQEIRSICDILERENGGKEDLAFLLESLRLRYPPLEHSPHLPALLENLREQLPFTVSQQELLTLWQPE